LELFGEWLGVLRYRISYVVGAFEVSHRFGDVPEPAFVVRDGSGRELPWSPQGWGGTESEADGDVEVRELPETGELKVEVPRLVFLVFDEETGEERVDASRDGPWSYRFSSDPASSALGGRAAFSGLGQDEEQGQDHYQDEAGRDADEREREGEEVGCHPEHVAARHGP